MFNIVIIYNKIFVFLKAALLMGGASAKKDFFRGPHRMNVCKKKKQKKETIEKFS